MLSLTILPITATGLSNNVLTMGASGAVPIALQTSGANGAVTYTVSTSSSQGLSTYMTANTDQTVQFTLSDGSTMDYQLFDDLTPLHAQQMESLVSSGAYVSAGAGVDRWVGTGSTAQAIQFGQTAGVSASALSDEYSNLLQYTTSGELAAASPGGANSGSTGSFFVTNGANSSWNNQYTIYGMLTSSDTERQTIQALSGSTQAGYTFNASSGNFTSNTGGKDLIDPVITGATLLSASQATGHVMILSAASSASASDGPITVTVTATDASGQTATESFQVAFIAAAPTVPVSSVNGGKGYAQMTGSTTGTASGSFTIPVTTQDPASDIEYFLASTALSSSTPSYSTSVFSNVTVSPTTGQVSLTAAKNAAGLGWVEVLVYDSNSASPQYSTADIPVYVDPPTLSASNITLASASQNGGATDPADTTSLNNSSGSQELTFEVSGGLPGATLTLYGNGQALGSATVVSGTSTTQIVTNGSYTLGTGQNQITVQQTLPGQTATDSTTGWTYNGGTAVTVSGAVSGAFDLNVLAPPTFNAVGTVPTAYLGTIWTEQVTAQPSIVGDSLQYSLASTGAGVNATINSSTGVITWEVPAGYSAATASFTVRATEINPTTGAALTSSQQSLTANVAAPTETPPVFSAVGTVPTAYTDGQWTETVTAQPFYYGDSIQYSVVSPPAGVNAFIDNPSTGVITWNVPSGFTPQTIQLTVQATEISPTGQTLSNNTAQQTLSVTVANPPPPAFNPLGTVPAATQGQTWAKTVTAQPFNAADTVQYSLGTQPAGASAVSNATINPATGAITWSVPANYPATTTALTVVATEIDHTSGAALQSSSLAVPITVKAPGTGNNTGNNSGNNTGNGGGPVSGLVAIPLSSSEISLLTPTGFANSGGVGAETVGTSIGGTLASGPSTLTVSSPAGGVTNPRSSAALATSTIFAGGGLPLSDADIGSELPIAVRRVLGDTGIFGTQLSPSGGDGGAPAPSTAAPLMPNWDTAPVEPHVEKNKDDSSPSQPQEPTSYDPTPEMEQSAQQLADDQPLPADVESGSPAAIDRALEEMLDEAIAATARMVALL